MVQRDARYSETRGYPVQKKAPDSFIPCGARAEAWLTRRANGRSQRYWPCSHSTPLFWRERRRRRLGCILSSGPSKELHVEASVREGVNPDAIYLVDRHSLLRIALSLHHRSARESLRRHNGETNLVCLVRPVRPVRPASPVSPHRTLLAIRFTSRLSLTL